MLRFGRALPAEHDLGALLDATADQRLNPLPLSLTNERTHDGPGISRVTDGDEPERVSYRGHQIVVE